MDQSGPPATATDTPLPPRRLNVLFVQNASGHEEEALLGVCDSMGCNVQTWKPSGDPPRYTHLTERETHLSWLKSKDFIIFPPFENEVPVNDVLRASSDLRHEMIEYASLTHRSVSNAHRKTILDFVGFFDKRPGAEYADNQEELYAWSEHRLKNWNRVCTAVETEFPVRLMTHTYYDIFCKEPPYPFTNEHYLIGRDILWDLITHAKEKRGI
ncbi:hypothetical protein GE09DRAFT_510704 [Coniochaeta sp. 2T2.1]|nr:hypothetical protein GE09DRAFT_510704 [Coniochaeta sp. 2T2.1]